jgi:hypothetical protein
MKANPILVPHIREIRNNDLFYPNRAEQLEIAARTKPTSQSQLIGQLPRKNELETKQNNPVKSSNAVYPRRQVGVNFIPSEVIQSSEKKEDQRNRLNESIVQAGFKVQEQRVFDHLRHVEKTKLIRN